MENRVTVSICGEEYTFVAEEAPSYMQKVGAYVGTKMDEMLTGAKVGRTDAAVLAAANIADELFKYILKCYKSTCTTKFVNNNSYMHLVFLEFTKQVINFLCFRYEIRRSDKTLPSECCRL